MIACDCPVCTSSDPHDRRTRTSAALTFNGHTILIDTAPELRLQCLATDVRCAHAVFLTHGHADHVAGLDDIRRFNEQLRRTLEVYGDAATLAIARRMFSYAFTDDPDYPSAKPHLRAVEIDGPIDLFGRTITPIPYWHGPTRVLGYRVGAVAYCPDCSAIPNESRPLLADLDILVLDALRRRPHPTHFNLDQAIAEAERIGARRTIFTHIAHELGHAETCAALPTGMTLAYDGMVAESD